MKHSILVVDDDAGIRGTLVDILRLEGYEVHAAESGEQALSICAETTFDFGLLDIGLPGMSGMELLGELKQIQPECDVIILTATGTLSTAMEALRLGAHDYLLKPIRDLDELLMLIGRALEHRETVRENERLQLELQTRRRQQLRYMAYIGKALSSALQPEDVARVLVEAMQELTDCRAAGILLLGNEPDAIPRALISVSLDEPAEGRRALLEQLILTLPESQRPSQDEIVLLDVLPAGRGPEPREKRWNTTQTSLLSVHGEPCAATILATDSGYAFNEDEQSFWDMLVTQASVAMEKAKLFAATQRLATRDDLTGLYNRRHLFELLEREINRAERYGHPLSVLMLDIDGHPGQGLKYVNDSYGHAAGDCLIRGLADYMQEQLRKADIIARYGGDEFVIVAPQAGRAQATAMAQRILKEVRGECFDIGEATTQITVSIGIATFAEWSGHTPATLLQLADQQLYRAKLAGGDQAMLPEMVPASVEASVIEQV